MIEWKYNPDFITNEQFFGYKHTEIIYSISFTRINSLYIYVLREKNTDWVMKYLTNDKYDLHDKTIQELKNYVIYFERRKKLTKFINQN
jgi:hypothetical protein